MTRLRQFIFCLALTATFSLRAQSLPDSTGVVPPSPPQPSPVNFFRELLALSPLERAAALTNRPPESRERILAKVQEYLALEPDERELRLRATELRWYLTPLLRVPAAERATRLASVPEDLRELVKSRLLQWEILPPPLQEEFLANNQTLHYFAHVETTNQATARQQQVVERINRFFELTAEEKQQTLNTLSDNERAEMEKTLQLFDKLPPQQRLICVRNYAKFAGMSAGERAEFLKNADRWSKMSPQERQTWRDLVEQVPIWPPMPQPMLHQMIAPPVPIKTPQMLVATNLN